MKKTILQSLFSVIIISSFAQTSPGTTANSKKDSISHAKMIQDSLNMEKFFAVEQFPYIKGSKWSGIIPVDGVTEIPDPNHDYKLLFEVFMNNPDSMSKEINQSPDEVTRILNLHFASGIPAKIIIPVIVVHGPALNAINNNENYQKKYKTDNPNLKLIDDLENAGTKFIACGQAMAFFDVKKEELLPEIKISLTAQTVLSNYQSKGYVLYVINPEK
jgi:intracellular sulfur oxidation DsrE/DsrF family protein